MGPERKGGRRNLFNHKSSLLLKGREKHGLFVLVSKLY